MSDYHMTDSVLVAVHTFPSHVLMSFFVDTVSEFGALFHKPWELDAKILRDFVIETDHLILARRPDLEMIEKNKKNKKRESAVLWMLASWQTYTRESKEIKKRNKYLNLPIELRKLWNVWVTVIPIVIGVLGMVPKGLNMGAGRIGNWKTYRNRPNKSIVETGHNTEKSSWDLWRYPDTKTPQKDHQPTLVRKLTRRKLIIIIKIVIGAFGTITKGLLKGLEDLEVGGRVESNKMTALLRTARILRRVLEETCFYSNSSEKLSANTEEKNSKRVNNQQKKENLQNCGLCCPGWPLCKIERKWKEG